MAAPNIVQTATIYGKTVGMAPTTTAGVLIANAAASGKLLKINSIIVANIDGASAYSITADLYKNQTTAYPFAWLISVPALATLVLISKESGFYLEENDSIRLTASTNSKLSVICAYEDIS